MQPSQIFSITTHSYIHMPLYTVSRLEFMKKKPDYFQIEFIPSERVFAHNFFFRFNLICFILAPSLNSLPAPTIWFSNWFYSPGKRLSCTFRSLCFHLVGSALVSITNHRWRCIFWDSDKNRVLLDKIESHFRMSNVKLLPRFIFDTCYSIIY